MHIALSIIQAGLPYFDFPLVHILLYRRFTVVVVVVVHSSTDYVIIYTYKFGATCAISGGNLSSKWRCTPMTDTRALESLPLCTRISSVVYVSIQT